MIMTSARAGDLTINALGGMRVPSGAARHDDSKNTARSNVELADRNRERVVPTTGPSASAPPRL